MTRSAILIVGLLVFVSGCQHNPLLPEATQIVLQAYLYDGKPVTDISVMLSRPISSPATANTPVSDARVILLKNGISYQLAPTPQQSGVYAYPGSDLQVRSGDQFEIEVTDDGTTATAATVVPARPVGLSVNTPTIVFTRDTTTGRNGGVRIEVTSTDSVTVSWSNPTQLPFYVTVESEDSTGQPLRADSLGNVVSTRRFVTEPTTNSYFRVPEFDFTYTGRVRITLFRVNKEYVDLYASRQQDSRSLNEPATNITNGLGIFTAFASDSAYVTVQLQ